VSLKNKPQEYRGKTVCILRKFAGTAPASIARAILLDGLGADKKELLGSDFAPVEHDDFRRVVRKMGEPRHRENPPLLKAVTLLMPDDRLSKFQACLPEKLKLKLVADTILDVDNVSGQSASDRDY
jgi:hypothetical protein